MRVKEEDPGPPVEPPAADESAPDGPLGGRGKPPKDKPVDKVKEARKRERRKDWSRGLEREFPDRFRLVEGADADVIIGHNPMAPEYDHLRIPEPDDGDA
jgi:hypothetical protein